MEPIKNIKLNFKCNENWDEMIPCKDGRHCSVCNKTVYDFTNKILEDLKKISNENNHSICGRFKKEQTIYHKPKWYNRIAKIAASFLVIIGLSNCKETTKNESFKNENKVETDEKINSSYHSLGVPVTPLKGNVQIPKTENKCTVIGAIPIIKLENEITTIDSFSNSKLSKALKNIEENHTVGEVVDWVPMYINGGEDSMMNFLNENIINIDSIEGNVLAKFTVDLNGHTKNIEIVKSLSKRNDEEVARVIRLLNFKPIKKEYYYSIPINFEIEK